MPTNSIVEFIVYVVPGFIAAEIYHQRYPVRERSDAIQISWSVVYGLGITYALRFVDKTLLHGLLRSDGTTSVSFEFVMGLTFGGIIVGVAFIGLRSLRYLLGTSIESLKGLLPDPQTIWVYVNRKTNMDWAVVYVDDGSIYIGIIHQYRSNPIDQDQDFLLAKARRVDDKLKPQYSVTGQGVYLNTRNVKRIEYLQGE